MYAFRPPVSQFRVERPARKIKPPLIKICAPLVNVRDPNHYGSRIRKELEAFFSLVPDWVCEILSPATAQLDMVRKLPRYAAAVTRGEVLFEYEQRPLPPPIVAGHQVFRSVDVAGGSFSDWFALHDAHVYRFPRPG